MRVRIEMPSGAQSKGYERGDDWEKWFEKVVAEVKRLELFGTSILAEDIGIEARRETYIKESA
jgi:hypothetical protein